MNTIRDHFYVQILNLQHANTKSKQKASTRTKIRKRKMCHSTSIAFLFNLDLYNTSTYLNSITLSIALLPQKS